MIRRDIFMYDYHLSPIPLCPRVFVFCGYVCTLADVMDMQHSTTTMAFHRRFFLCLRHLMCRCTYE